MTTTTEVTEEVKEVKPEVKTETVSESAKIKEFRDTNIALKQKIESLEATITKISQGLEADQEKALLSAGKIDELVALRAEKMKADYEAKIAELSTKSTNFRAQLENSKVDAEISRLAAEKGVRPEAIKDALAHGKQLFKMSDDGKVVAMKDGNVLFNKKNEEFTISDWLSEQQAQSPHWFQESTGGATQPTKPTLKNGGKVKIKRSDFSKGLSPEALRHLASGNAVLVD